MSVRSVSAGSQGTEIAGSGEEMGAFTVFAERSRDGCRCDVRLLSIPVRPRSLGRLCLG